jgi:8-oxo-dGTP diphosphatase
MSEVREKALAILDRDKTTNANIINFIKSYQVTDFIIDGNSVLCKGKSDRTWVYISSKNKAEFEKLYSQLNNEYKAFAVLDDWMVDYILEKNELVWRLDCEKLVYPKDSSLEDNVENIRPLRESDAKYIYVNSKYQDFTPIDYIKERIMQGVGFGIEKEGKLVAWILTHDDGAIGFLNVLEDYRRKGYAKELTLAMIRELRKQDQTPFLHIEKDNYKSMNLALKMGFEKFGKINWIEVK